MFQATENLDVVTLQTRMWFARMAKQAAKYSRALDMNPNDPVALVEFGRSMTYLFNMAEDLTGTSANTARNLAAHRIEVVGDEVITAAASRANPEDLVKAREVIQKTRERVSKKTAKKAVDTARIDEEGAVSAADFSLARERKQAEAALKRLGIDPRLFDVDPEDLAQARSREIREGADLQRADPLEAPKGVPAGARRTNPIEEMSKFLDDADRQIDRIEKKQLELGSGVVKSVTRVKDTPFDARLREIADDPDNALRAIQDMTHEEMRATARMIRFADGDPKATMQILKAYRRVISATRSGDQIGMSKAVRYYLNALLSNPSTQFVNSVSTAINTAKRPIEMFWAATDLKSDAATRRQLLRSGWDVTVGLQQSLAESWRMARLSWKLGRNVLDPEGAVGEIADTVGDHWLEKLFQLPSRMLLTTDEFFKQMNYRGEVYRQSMDLIRKDGLTNTDQIARRVKQDMDAAFNLNETSKTNALYGSGVNPRALQVGREFTFTQQLEARPGIKGMARRVQDAVNDVPVLRLFVPFIRTPTNLIRWQVHHAPIPTPLLRRISREVDEALKEGGERAAIARARTQMGAALYITAGLYASQGGITGRGPRDPKLRKQWLDAGWKPYSIRVPGGWISYRRLDPVMVPFALVADFVQSSGDIMAAPGGEKRVEELGIAFVAALSNSLTSKVWMQGAVEGMDALTSGAPHKLKRFIASRAASALPFSAAVRGLAQSSDPVYREAETWQLRSSALAEYLRRAGTSSTGSSQPRLQPVHLLVQPD
jgi:hypothetical protein